MTVKHTVVATGSDFDFESRFVRIQGHRIHYVETGSGKPILLLHGNPTSSYAFRNVLRPLAEASGRRCITLDLLGFGKSDKPGIAHRAALHSSLIEGFIQTLDLQDILLYGEDWGGFLGAHVMVRLPERFKAAAFAETFLWPMTYREDFDPRFVMPFKLMRSPVGRLFSQGLNLMINKLIPEHCPISPESLQYYRDCVPDWKSRKAIGDFPRLLPVGGSPSESHAFALEVQAGLSRISFPVLWILAEPGTVVSHVNPIGMGRLEDLRRRLPQMEVRDFGKGYHYLTEENPQRWVEIMIAWAAELSGA